MLFSRRRMMAIAAAGLAILLATAPLPALADPPGEGKVVVWMFNQAVMERLQQDFAKDYPGYEVEYVQMPAPDLGFRCQPWVRPAEGVAAADCLAAADRIAEGRLDIHTLKGFDIGSPPRWNRDPRTGIEAPLAFGKTLDCADTDLVGDVEYLREANRHRHLVTLARAFTERVVPLLASGAVRPVIDDVYRPEQVGEAHARLEASDTFGKLVLKWS